MHGQLTARAADYMRRNVARYGPGALQRRRRPQGALDQGAGLRDNAHRPDHVRNAYFLDNRSTNHKGACAGDFVICA
jgi:hypothetical protein